MGVNRDTNRRETGKRTDRFVPERGERRIGEAAEPKQPPHGLADGPAEARERRPERPGDEKDPGRR